MSDDLKPCPFCGGPASAFRLHSWTVPSVRCQNNCTDETDIEEWDARPIEDALRARAEAAEVRAAQAEADARLMAGLAFVSFVERTSFSTEIVEASLLDALDAAGDHAAAVSDADLIAAVRRILAAGGAA